jgi:hypothetical protein
VVTWLAETQLILAIKETGASDKEIVMKRKISPPQLRRGKPKPRSASPIGRSINEGLGWGGAGQENQFVDQHHPGASSHHSSPEEGSFLLKVILASLIAIFSASTAVAQMRTDFSGEWTVVRSQDNTENPWVGDWFGLPLNKAGLARAESWDASILSLPEYQCRPHGWAYISRGPTQLRISKEVDPYSREVIAYHPEWHQSTDMPVYLDGRAHPPAEAAHAWGATRLARGKVTSSESKQPI